VPTSEIDFQDLLEALDNITALLTRFTPKDLGQLASLRVRVMRSLTSFLKLQDERCSQLLLSSSTENKATARQIKKEVSDLRALISAHVARWSPDAIKTDPVCYKEASNNLQRNIRNILRHPTA
jgi:hypothetical protein